MEIIVGSPERHGNIWKKKKCYKCRGNVFLSDNFTIKKNNVKYMCGHCFLNEKMNGKIIISDETVEKLGVSKEFLKNLLVNIKKEYQKENYGEDN